jgi:hypothetical protein
VISQQYGILGSSISPKRTRGKQIIYRFNGDPRHDEFVVDRTGKVPFSRIGETLRRNGKQWRVAVINNDLNMTASKIAIPIHHVFLTDKF